MMHDGWGWGMMGGWMWLLWLLLLVAIVALVVWVVRSAGRPPGRTQAPPSAPASSEDILRERYARGEIDETEYRRRMDELRR